MVALFFLKMIKIQARAKINLYLDVLGRYPDGYHEIATVMQSVGLRDTLTLKPSSTITLACSDHRLQNTSNLAHRAAVRLKQETGADQGVDIYVEKMIPVGAGLAGGSADAAAVLHGLNIMWNLNLDKEELSHIGFSLGADVPFCLVGGTALVRGRGEQVTAVKPLESLYYTLIKPPASLETGRIYQSVDDLKLVSFGNVDEFVSAVEHGETGRVIDMAKNRLETAAMVFESRITSLKRAALDAGAAGALMSGSGPTVIAITKSLEEALSVNRSLSDAWSDHFVATVEPKESGIKVLDFEGKSKSEGE